MARPPLSDTVSEYGQSICELEDGASEVKNATASGSEQDYTDDALAKDGQAQVTTQDSRFLGVPP